MKAKEESGKTRLHLSIKKTKIMTTEELHDFNIENEDIENVKDFAYYGSDILSGGQCSKEIKRKLRLGRTVMEELGKIIKSKDVSLG